MVSRMCEHQHTQTVSEMIICVMQKKSSQLYTLEYMKKSIGLQSSLAGQRVRLFMLGDSMKNREPEYKTSCIIYLFFCVTSHDKLKTRI